MRAVASLWWGSSNTLWRGRNFYQPIEGMLQNPLCRVLAPAWIPRELGGGGGRVFKEREVSWQRRSELLFPLPSPPPRSLPSPSLAALPLARCPPPRSLRSLGRECLGGSGVGQQGLRFANIVGDWWSCFLRKGRSSVGGVVFPVRFASCSVEAAVIRL